MMSAAALCYGKRDRMPSQNGGETTAKENAGGK